MKKGISSLLFIAIAFFSNAQDKTKQLDSLFKSLYAEKKLYGNVLIADKDNIIYQASFGLANHETNAALDAESIFELASVSKQFTAMGIMLLKKQGKLQYSDSLQKFIPGFPYPGITVRHLLNHTSGLPDYMELFAQHWDSTKIATNKDIIELMTRHRPAPVFDPGEKWEYSNTGYALLATIIEKASGSEFGKYLEKNIFKPLDMKRTLVLCRRFEKKTPPNYAFGYVREKEGDVYVLPDGVPGVGTMVYSLDGIMGDGTVNSTTTDLLKWDRALYTEKLVSHDAMKEAYTPATLNSGKTHPYGFGWATGTIEGIGSIVNHSGGWPGYGTLIERHLETGRSIIILLNHETGSRPPMQKIRNILYGLTPADATVIALDSTKLKLYAGEYELAPGFTISITTEKDKIFAQATGQNKFEIFAEEQDKFFLKVVEAKIKFTRNEKGVVTGLILYQGGQEIEGPKIN